MFCFCMSEMESLAVVAAPAFMYLGHRCWAASCLKSMLRGTNFVPHGPACYLCLTPTFVRPASCSDCACACACMHVCLNGRTNIKSITGEKDCLASNTTQYGKVNPAQSSTLVTAPFNNCTAPHMCLRSGYCQHPRNSLNCQVQTHICKQNKH